MNAEPLRIMHITDTHILGESGAELCGVDTFAALGSLLSSTQNDTASPHCVIATGDLSQDGSAGSYQRLHSLLEPLNLPVYCLPGNHDDPSQMHAHLKGGLIHIERRVVLGSWQIVMLDSRVPGQDHGYLGADQLDFLEQTLSAASDQPAIVGLHHGPYSVCPMPACCLENAEEFLALLKRCPQIRGVISGHNHHAIDEHYGDIRLLVTPSTCLHAQHPSGPNIPAPDEWRNVHKFDPQKRGFRRLELYPDGRIVTELVWV